MKKLKKITPLSWLVLGALILRIPSLFEPYWYGDEAIYLTLGEALRQGRILYLEIFDHKPPAIYALAALAGSIFWFKFILLVWHAVTIVLFWKLAEVIFKKQEKPVLLSSIIFTILTTLPFLEGNIVNSEILLIGPVIFAFLIILTLPAFDPKKLFGAGLLFSLAILLKIPAVFDFGALGAFWLLTTKTVRDSLVTAKKLAFVIAGLAVPILLTFAWFWTKGALAQYIDVAWSQNFTYINLWGQTQLAGFEFGLQARGIAFAAILVALFAFRRYIEENLMFAVLWFCFTLFAALLAGRPYPHYLIQVVPPLSILVAMVIYGSRKQQVLPIPFFLLFAASLVFYKFYYYPTFPYYQNFFEFALGKKTKEAYFANFNKKTPRTYKIAQLLQDRTTKQESVFIWGTAPEIYALSRRLPPGRFVTSFHIKDFAGKKETILALEANKPKYILTMQEEKDVFDELFLFLNKNYILLETIDGVGLWRRVSPDILKAISRPI